MEDQELFGLIEADLKRAALRRNPGVDPEAHALTEREKIIASAVRRHAAAGPAGLSASQLRMFERVAPKDGA